MQAQRLEKVVEILSISFLITAGSLGLFVSILDFIGTDFENGPWKWLKGPLPIILIVTSILAVGLGLERYVRLQEFNRRITNIEGKLANAIGGQFLEDYDKLYSTAKSLVQDAKRSIKSAGLMLDYTPSPKYYLDAFVEVLAESQNWPKPITADIVLGSDFDKSPQLIHNTAEKLGGLLEKKKINTACIYAINVPWGFDFLIVDDKHCILVFPVMRANAKLKAGVAFINRQDVARDVENWFDEFMIKRAVPYEEFCKAHPVKSEEESQTSHSDGASTACL